MVGDLRDLPLQAQAAVLAQDLRQYFWHASSAMNLLQFIRRTPPSILRSTPGSIAALNAEKSLQFPGSSPSPLDSDLLCQRVVDPELRRHHRRPPGHQLPHRPPLRIHLPIPFDPDSLVPA